MYAISLSVVVVLSSSSWFLMQNGLFASHDSQKNIAYALSMFLEVVGVVLFERCDFYFLIMANGGCVCVTVCVRVSAIRSTSETRVSEKTANIQEESGL